MHQGRISKLVRRLLGSWQPIEGSQADDPQYIASEYLRSLRDRLRNEPHRKGPSAPEKRNRYRYAKRKVSEHSRKLLKGKQLRLDKGQLLASYKPSPLLDALLPNRRALWRMPAQRRAVGSQSLAIKGFSFIDHPEETLAKLKLIAELECVSRGAQLHFDDDFCIDIAPYLVLAEFWPEMLPLFRGGRMSHPIQKVVSAVGLSGRLGMRLPGAGDSSEVWAFPLERRNAQLLQDPDRELSPQRKEKVADSFCDAVDSWLGEFDMELTDSGKARFGAIITEMLDNAERHSGTDLDNRNGGWSCAAFMARRTEGGKDVFRCYMGFLSVGKSIAESLVHAPEDVREEINDYVRKHSKRRQSAETLTTLYAMQDGITRVHDARASGRGGIGFQEVISFVTALSGPSSPGKDPRLTVVSGGSCIKLRAPYFVPVRRGIDQPRVIWCNKTNSPHTTPDPDYVFDLADSFGGTIVGLSFVLDPEYLEAAFNDGN